MLSRFAGACALALIAMACSGTVASTAYTPPTGITIRAESLVAPFGCGVGAGEVFKYAAVVYDASKAVRGAEIYDCFADGPFVNLVSTTTSSAFTVKVYAFDAQKYRAQQSVIDRAIHAVDGNGVLNPGTSTLDQLRTYATDCTATQQSGVQVLAVCKPLQ